MTTQEIQIVKEKIQWVVDHWEMWNRINRVFDDFEKGLDPDEFLELFSSLWGAGMIETAIVIAARHHEMFPLYGFLEKAAYQCIADNAEEFIPEIYEHILQEAKRKSDRKQERIAAGNWRS